MTRPHGYLLTPGRYVAAEALDDDEALLDNMRRLTAQLEGQFSEGARLKQAIREGLKGLRF